MRIAILTNFREWRDSYSLTHVVHAQALTLAKYGHNVTVFTMEGCGEPEPVDLPFGYLHWPCLTKDTGIDTKTLTVTLPEFDVVFTHDWALNAGNTLLRDSLFASRDSSRDVPFLHWIHSAPNFGPFEFWDISLYGRKAKIVYPSYTDLPLVAEKFKARRDQIRHIPNIVDLRIFNEWHPDSWAIVDELPGLMQADFVQVYPAERWRMGDNGKQVRKLITFFKFLKQQGASICLLIADSWSGFGESGSISEYQGLALSNDLSPQEISFSSTLMNGKFPDGLPKRVLRELQQCSSVFIYPTHGEAFGLPLPETVLASGALPCINADLPMMEELSGGFGCQASFGSCRKGYNPLNEREFYVQSTLEFHTTAMCDESWKSRVYARQAWNIERVYENFYEPILREVTA